MEPAPNNSAPFPEAIADKVADKTTSPSSEERASPSSPGIILLHGLTGSPHDFDELASQLESVGYQTKAPQLAGHRSLEDLESCHWYDWVESADAAVDEFLLAGTKKIGVVGLSMGGLLALRLAAKRPRIVQAVVSLAAPLALPRWQGLAARALTTAREASKQLSQVFPPGQRLTEAIGHHTKRGRDMRAPQPKPDPMTLPEMPFSSIVELTRLQADLQKRLSHIRTPCLLVHGDHDQTANPTDLDAFKHRIGQHRGANIVETLRLSNSGHVLPLDLDRKLLNREIMSFLQKHLPATSAQRATTSSS